MIVVFCNVDMKCDCIVDNCMLLVMEFVSNGCLRDFLKRPDNSQLTAAELLRFGRETAEVSLSSDVVATDLNS
jgi:Protein tyrosine and serine/threonine kinase